MADILRIANASGFFGDRLTAAQEMVDGGPIDVLTGDYLAELTMMILLKAKQKDPSLGYVGTFLKQYEEVARTCAARGIKVVVNAGGLNPRGCADAVRAVGERLGVPRPVAHVEGDDLLSELESLQKSGEPLAHLDKGTALAALQEPVLSANAYLGAWGIVTALSRGAEVVICPRVTDAALALGPAAWHFGWKRDDWDRLAAGVVAGHILECGPQATGGNYPFFRRTPGLERPGFPLVEMSEDGTFVVTKHPGTGGMVTVGTVTAQILYEIGSPRYANPDVVARFDTIRLEQEGPDRVRVLGVRGEPAPSRTKVCINHHGGYRNGMTFILTGLDIEEKAALAERTIWELVGGRDQFAETEVTLRRSDREDPQTNEDAFALLTVSVKDPDPKKVGRSFSSKAIEMALSSYPGFKTTGLPGPERQFGVYWPALVDAARVPHRVALEDGRTLSVPPPARSELAAPLPDAPLPDAPLPDALPTGATTRRLPIGRLCGARSGDKGGHANLGVWVESDDAYRWLTGFLTVERLKALLVETAPLRVTRYALPRIRALNFVIEGLLGDGVAASMRADPQAKTLAEYFRAKVVDVPTMLALPEG